MIDLPTWWKLLVSPPIILNKIQIKYDAKTEKVTFVTIHLSKYVIGDTARREKNCPTEKFTDLNKNLWYHEYTDYVISHSLMSGVGDGLW